MFLDKHLRGLKKPHYDVVVISMVATNFEVRKIMIDSKSVADSLFNDALERIKLPKE